MTDARPGTVRVIARRYDGHWDVLYKGQYAGFICTYASDLGPRTIGYEIRRDFWNLGIASKAVRNLLRRNKWPKVHAWTLPSNKASQRVLKKNGFKYIGLRPESGFFWFERKI